MLKNILNNYVLYLVRIKRQYVLSSLRFNTKEEAQKVIDFLKSDSWTKDGSCIELAGASDVTKRIGIGEVIPDTAEDVIEDCILRDGARRDFCEDEYYEEYEGTLYDFLIESNKFNYEDISIEH